LHFERKKKIYVMRFVGRTRKATTFSFHEFVDSDEEEVDCMRKVSEHIILDNNIWDFEDNDNQFVWTDPIENNNNNNNQYATKTTTTRTTNYQNIDSEIVFVPISDDEDKYDDDDDDDYDDDKNHIPVQFSTVTDSPAVMISSHQQQPQQQPHQHQQQQQPLQNQQSHQHQEQQRTHVRKVQSSIRQSFRSMREGLKQRINSKSSKNQQQQQQQQNEATSTTSTSSRSTSTTLSGMLNSPKQDRENEFGCQNRLMDQENFSNQMKNENDTSHHHTSRGVTQIKSKLWNFTRKLRGKINPIHDDITTRQSSPRYNNNTGGPLSSTENSIHVNPHVSQFSIPDYDQQFC
jgi:hypothetical protein